MSLRTAICGAATPLGATLVRIAAERGDRLAVVAAQPGRVPLFADLARERPDQVVLVGDSRRTPEEIAEAVVDALGGGIDRLILAGWQEHAGPTLNDSQANITLPVLDPALLLAHIDQNAVLPLALAQAFRLPLRRGNAPAILAITSWLGSLTTRTDGGHYGQGISAAALHMAMHTLAMDLEPDSIRVVIGNPGLYRATLHGPAVQPAADDVAAGLLAMLEAVNDETNGRMVDWKGRVLEW
jgi:NAD(P)-dependent dehydrogenase (short-subunit alcohol dehydrogenase family)